jgi:hypothetical protein
VRKKGELDGESQRQEGTIVRQVSEIKGLKTTKKKSEDELERSTRARVRAAEGRKQGDEGERGSVNGGSWEAEGRDATGCDISAELELIASHFCDFLRLPDALNRLSFSVIYDIISRGSLRLDNEDSFYSFIRKFTETNREMFHLPEFVRFEYCSPDVMNDFCHFLSGHFYEITTSIWTNFRARLVLLNFGRRQFPPSIKKEITSWGREYDVPDGIIAHLIRECGRNVHDRHVVDITSRSFVKETIGANLHSEGLDNKADCTAKNVADLEIDSCFYSAYCEKKELSHTRNNWLCYDFKERRIVPTHYAIRMHRWSPGYGAHLRSWLIETLADGKIWQEVAREEDNEQLNGCWLTDTCTVAGGGKCRFIRLVNIGRNHGGNDWLAISGWEIFGGLLE